MLDRVAVSTNMGGSGGWKPEYEYGKYFTGRVVVKLGDNDAAGRIHNEAVCKDVCSFAFQLFTLDLPVGEGQDISDFLQKNTIEDLIKLLESERKLYAPPSSRNISPDLPWAAEGIDTFLASTEMEVAFLERDVLAPGCLTQIFAPRGIGKSVLADHWAVKLASAGKRVLILDRDNPRSTLKSRLRSLGADELGDKKTNIRVIRREKCPPLTRPEEWATFPYLDYDAIIVDSIDAMTEGVGGPDSSKPARAMAPLLDICRHEHGPAVLLLGNTVKTAAHSRGSGVMEDRADMVYEVRDAAGAI